MHPRTERGPKWWEEAGEEAAGRAWAPPFQGEEARGRVQVGLRGPVASGVEFIPGGRSHDDVRLRPSAFSSRFLQ